ncbi:MAG: 50S ribosomal protein L11 methyltransferase [Solirubrobacterales bacterium]|nr:50S ribosomal protein L11 methyltransferase [Solirubrobacterales bacterium]
MIRLAVRCAPEQAELVLAELTVLAPGGVEEVAGDGYVEFAIYGAEGELPDLGEEEAVIAGGTVAVSASEVADDWADRWRTFHKPLLVGDPELGPAVWIRPPWEPERADLAEVVVDPGQAFGTGAHPTTRLCIEALIEIARTGGPFGPLTDLGCGSGVLAIAAGKLGWDPLEGCDNEVAAVEAARENAKVNGVEAKFERIDLKAGLPTLAPTTVANLTAPLLEAVAAGLTPGNLPETLICSGLLNTEYDRVMAAFGPHGLVETGRGAMGDWGSLVLVREGSA